MRPITIQVEALVEDDNPAFCSDRCRFLHWNGSRYACGAFKDVALQPAHRTVNRRLRCQACLNNQNKEC